MRTDGQMAMSRLARTRRDMDPALWCLALICGCFTLTSESYIEWLYRLMELAPKLGADWHAMVGNYAFQGLGMLLAALHVKRRARTIDLGQPLLLAAFVLHASFAISAALASTRVAVVVFGTLMALFSGFIQAFYLIQLSQQVEPGRRGVLFGLGYACSIGLTWLFSLGRGYVGHGIPYGLVTSILCTVATMMLLLGTQPRDRSALSTLGNDGAEGIEVPAIRTGTPATSSAESARATIALASALVLLASAEKSLGFGFPPTDIALGVSVEFSRLFYAAGLVAAGIAADYRRSYGVACGMAALVTPFALLALSGEPVSSTVLWSLDYLLYGFFALFRVTLFLDLSTRESATYLACFGLMFGRLGDAAGNALSLALSGNNVALVGLAGVMLICAIPMALQLFPNVYAPEPTIVYKEVSRTSDSDRLGRFAQYYDLSRREREVLDQVLASRTNVEAAELLYVSESTIKFHIRNLLRKTGCRNRVELRELYTAWK